VNPRPGAGIVKASLATVVPNGLDTKHARDEDRLKHVDIEEEGVKHVSESSIKNIREDSNVIQISFDDNNQGIKSYLPGGGGSDHRNSQPKQIGVIRPISRENDTSPHLKLRKGDNKIEKSVEKGKNAKNILEKVNNVNNSVEKVSKVNKETLVIDKDPIVHLTPANKWTENAQITHDSKIKLEQPKSTTTSESVISERLSSPKVTLRAPVTPQNKSIPPAVPLRNGSKLEHGNTQESPKNTVTLESQNTRGIDDSINTRGKNEKTSTKGAEENQSVRGGQENKNSQSTPTNQSIKNKEGNGNYRDGWKARKEQENSLVFNFVGSKKDTSHIENDGLDLSKRNAKQNNKDVILLDPNGESCDAEDGGGDGDVSSNRFTFVGAEIKTGKSSLRSREKTKKLSISFNDKTEVFEYPSFESSTAVGGDKVEKEDLEPSNNTNNNNHNLFKSNTAVGSSGGLGSYTPSKIQMSEAPFQLGVSRSTQQPNPSPAQPTSLDLGDSPALLPADQGISWGHAASSDMLF